MADIANLARHLLMTEVLQICESVHKQVEEQKLTVYQRGDVHTVVSSLPTSQDEVKDESYMVTIESDGRAVVTHSGSLAVVSACLAMEQPQVAEAGTFVINVEPDTVSPSEVLKLASAAVAEAAVKKEVEPEEYTPLEEEEPSADEGHADKQEMMSDDPNKRRLRQRSIAEGGYARLHMGSALWRVWQSQRSVQRKLQDQPPAAGSAVEGEHTCSECGMSFQRRYSLIMHTLKHEKARGYKCSVSTGVGQHLRFQYIFTLISFHPLLQL
uniref:C2H2-type domain-containing protein n=1 Tax=Lates calcarifer TaxID=8187 RepID=A0A4W6DN39_LATCA